MDISSNFDSGNIEVIDASDPQRVLLAMRADLKSYHFQWFHFKVENLIPGQRYGFSLTNAGQSAYSHAWTGYNAVASYDQVDGKAAISSCCASAATPRRSARSGSSPSSTPVSTWPSGLSKG